MSPGRTAAQHPIAGIENVDGACFRAKEFDHLPQRDVQYLVKIERLRRDDGDGIQCSQFAVTATNLFFRAFLVRDIDQESLVALDLAVSVTCGKTVFEER